MILPPLVFPVPTHLEKRRKQIFNQDWCSHVFILNILINDLRFCMSTAHLNRKSRLQSKLKRQIWLSAFKVIIIHHNDIMAFSIKTLIMLSGIVLNVVLSLYLFLQFSKNLWFLLNFVFKRRHYGQSLSQPGNTKGGSITVPLTSCLTGLEPAVWQVTIFVFICKTD